MISRIALAAALVAGATGAILAVRSERAREAAQRGCRATGARARSRATQAAERIDLMIRDMEASDEPRTGIDWRYQTLVGARDALVSVGQSADEVPESDRVTSNGSMNG